MKIEETQNGKILIDCSECGKMFETFDFRGDECESIIRENFEKIRLCPECSSVFDSNREKELESEVKKKRFTKNLENSGIPALYTKNRYTGALFTECPPPVPYAARWIWNHSHDNLLCSGETGSGKSTSACYVAVRLILENVRIRYCTMRKLLSEWRDAKTSDRPSAAENFLQSLFRYDILIIDEVVGKARITESGQELLFDLIESVNSGESSVKIWLLGNFYTGSIEDLFSDPLPVRRRLHENFLCVLFDRKTQKISPLTVWQDK